MARCVNKQIANEQKRTQLGQELDAIRQGMKLNKAEFARYFKLRPRTMQDYIYGERMTPHALLERARAAQRQIEESTAKVLREVNEELDRKYPLGIRSEPEEE